MYRKKILASLFALCIASLMTLRAAFPLPDEGMWIVSLIKQMNIEQMQKLGCKLSADDIYNPDYPSLKDAVVEFSGICTGEFVSSNGLLFTNHHCGYDAVASVSTANHNYLDEGFWSKDMSEEIPIPDLYAKLLVRIEDVSDSIVPVVEGLDPMARGTKSREIQDRIEARNTSGDLTAEIKPVFFGNKYYMYIYRKYTDVRLVGVPPASIGEFGGDTDNWMWPRHTGDFSIFRVYADKNNNPAEYSKDNVPYHPKKFLNISISGLSQGDFTMIMGYPGSTDRYLTSYAIRDVMEDQNPSEIDAFKTLTDVIHSDMEKGDTTVNLKLASNYKELMNELKLYVSQDAGMNRMDAIAIKQQQEKEFADWLSKQDNTTKEKYGHLMDDFSSVYDDLHSVISNFYLKILAVVVLPTGNFALDFNQIESTFDKNMAQSDKDTIIAEIRKSADDMFSKMNYPTEEKEVAAYIAMLDKQLPDDQKPQVLKDILAKTKGATTEGKCMAWAEEAFSKSVFTTPEKLNAFLKNPSEKALKKDPLYNYYIQMYVAAQDVRPQYQKDQYQVGKLERSYVTALMMMHPDKKFYPDANFTMRLTYGTIEPYNPRDAVHYDWQTFLSGVMEKMDNSNPEFIVPDKLQQLYAAKDFGRYADKKTGKMPVCFLNNCDITGGNSGSPVMNANGELIGLAFDGDYEGTPGDYIFDPALNRTIAVDIRYVLFVIDKYAGAENIIKELNIVE